MSLKRSVQENYETTRAYVTSKASDTYLEDAGEDFVNDAKFFASREEFNDYMHSLEEKYYN